MMLLHGNPLQQHEFCNNPSYEIPTDQTVCVVMYALAKRYFRKSNPRFAFARSFEHSTQPLATVASVRAAASAQAPGITLSVHVWKASKSGHLHGRWNPQEHQEISLPVCVFSA